MYPFPFGSFICCQHRLEIGGGLLSQMVFLLLRSVGSRRNASCKFLKSRGLLVGEYCDSVKVSWGLRQEIQSILLQGLLLALCVLWGRRALP
jgi:hypothetical protein